MPHELQEMRSGVGEVGLGGGGLGKVIRWLGWFGC